ncbi:hypothetical protein DY000_02013985 [Brassica cretica]|uniref:F-box domain-containing protein n=1 Tax=Brassica cretica TaxID=69181 RepID=A0ABQ7D0I4_BRACR|nr:hypothetical protein DY000_02013985 [Brassica cretica]
MALNFSHRHFSSHLSDESMKIANGYLADGLSERNGDVFNHGRNAGDSASVDILDVLPSDPFGMDINNTFTAITGWLEDLEVDCSQYGRDEIWVGDGSHQLFAGLSFIWNNAMRFQEFPERNVYTNGAFLSTSSVDEVGESSGRCTTNDADEDVHVHPAFGFCLYRLGVKDLLSASMVCKSLHTTVCDDSLLWKHIHICQPLNEKITDEALLQLTERAQGTMQCLRLVDCSRVTDDCLKQVMERNPQVVKLGVSGCTRITIDGVLSILRDLKAAGKPQVKQLEIGGIFGVTKDHYDELFGLLDVDNNVEQSTQKPRFYHRGDSSCVSCDDDDRVLDIEMCPKCQNARLVYDCPAEDCKGKEECRACSLCIQRCFQCGRCINDSEYEETFCLEFLCADCSKSSLKLPLEVENSI